MGMVESEQGRCSVPESDQSRKMSPIEVVALALTESALDGLLKAYGDDSSDWETTGIYKRHQSDSYFQEFMLLRELLFPCFFRAYNFSLKNDRNLLRERLRDFLVLIAEGCQAYGPVTSEHVVTLRDLSLALPDIREMLKKDVEAAYCGDPAATQYAEVIRVYPGFKAIMVQRVAHFLWKKNMKGYARELCELVHELVHIDIHPGTSIGEYFFIDHGTGAVLGETAVIGAWVRIYQGVTLGTLHFEKDQDNCCLKKGYIRHPRIGSHVVIGAGSKILGPCRIGDNVSIGANCWIQDDVPEGFCVFISEFHQTTKAKRKTVSGSKSVVWETPLCALKDLEEDAVIGRGRVET